MINFIIYSNDCNERYSNLISKYVMNKNEKYNIIIANKYDNAFKEKIANLEGVNIYILEIDIPGKTGLELANNIRIIDNDWTSPIIVCYKENEIDKIEDKYKFLMITFIDYKNFHQILLKAVDIAYNILKGAKTYKFKYTNEYYKVPYNKILCIEKNTNDNYSTLVTKKSKYIIKDSISNILKNLDDERFILSSQSCIVNLDNISSVDFTNNIIKFDKVSTNLMSREGKKAIKDNLDL